jgi:hypothetical protein
MEAAFAPWAVVEKMLRKAKDHDLPISINGLLKLEEISSIINGPQQLRDIITTFQNKNMVTKHELTDEQRAGNTKDRIGYMWNRDFKGEPYRPTVRPNKKPSKATVTVPEKVINKPAKLTPEHPKAVELVFQGVTLTISRNPDTGNTRLVIEG